MTDTIIVPSVKQSGGDILVKHILSSYPEGSFKAPDSDGVIHDHVLYTKLDRLLDLADMGNPVIIPIRHPKVVAKLWESAGEELMPDFFQMWEDIMKFRNLPNTHYLPMDDKDVKLAIEVVRKKRLCTLMSNS